MTDFLLFEQIYRRIKENVKPRTVFKKGQAAKGYFCPYTSFSDHTESQIFAAPDIITPVTVRFSSMLGDNGTADTVRNIKAMDVKFESADGVYDMMCRSLPVFFINDIHKLNRLEAALSTRNPFDGINSRQFWEFVADNPEAINCVLRLFSYKGISESYIYIEMFSVNTTIWVNKYGRKWFVRYRWHPIKDNYDDESFIDANTAEFLAGYDPDRGYDQLISEISKGNFPCFELQVQLIEYKYAINTGNISSTLCWNDNRYPPEPVGIMKLETLAEIRRESDMLHFAPGNTVNGIELYRDDMTDVMDMFYKMEALERGELK